MPWLWHLLLIKGKGGAEKLRDKRVKSLHSNASKLTNLFGSSSSTCATDLNIEVVDQQEEDTTTRFVGKRGEDSETLIVPPKQLICA